MTLATIITAESHWDSKRAGTQDRLWEEGWLKWRQKKAKQVEIQQQSHNRMVEPGFSKGRTMKARAAKITSCNNVIFILLYLRKNASHHKHGEALEQVIQGAYGSLFLGESQNFTEQGSSFV